MTRDAKANERRAIRNLAALEASASTSRVMNLAVVERGLAEDPAAARIFASANLNKCIILKHTLRPHERELFSVPRKVATKIIFPFDHNDLKLGGTSVFLRQRNFERDTAELIRASRKDMALLNLLDSLPSLDPFLVKEHCARAGVPIPHERLALSPADVDAMQVFVHAEIKRLLLAAFPRFTPDVSERFSRKILTNAPDESMRPLMDALRMSDAEFWDGVFSWRGFLYYKWRLQVMAPSLPTLFAAIESYFPADGVDKEFSAYLAVVRPRLAQKLSTAIAFARSTIDIYNDAFDAMFDGGDATRFKRFLLEGPKLFVSLGEQVGLLDHFTSLWTYRRQGGEGRMSAVEYGDFLIDLDESLTATNRGARPQAL
jgi:hypothetical protein